VNLYLSPTRKRAADAGDKQHMRERGFAQSRASIVGLRIIIFSSVVRITVFHRHGCGDLLSIAPASAAAAAVAADACIRCSDPHTTESVLENEVNVDMYV